LSYVTATANLMCPFGDVGGALMVTSQQKMLIDGKPVATIQDAAPMSNIPTMGMCKNPANPQVMAATAAALGVLTPQPCVPSTVSWAPGAKASTLVCGKPALSNDCKCMCAWGGVISITFPGQTKVN
jgi:hypothetical protein